MAAASHDWPLPLPGHDVRLTLQSPTGRLRGVALLTLSIATFFIAMGRFVMWPDPRGGMVAFCGVALAVVAAYLLVWAQVHAGRTDLVLVIDRDGLTLPRLHSMRRGVDRLKWADAGRASMLLLQYANVELRLGGQVARISQASLPTGWSAPELASRIQIRATHAARGNYDPLVVAGLEAQVIRRQVESGAVVHLVDGQPQVIELVATPEEYVERLTGYPPDHRVIVASDLVEKWRAVVAAEVMNAIVSA